MLTCCNMMSCLAHQVGPTVIEANRITNKKFQTNKKRPPWTIPPPSITRHLPHRQAPLFPLPTTLLTIHCLLLLRHRRSRCFHLLLPSAVHSTSTADSPFLLLPSVYNPPSSSQDLVRTIFVGVFPEDVKAREIYNLFREFPGYESSHLRSTTTQSDAWESESQTRLKQPFAFAVFFDQQSAIAAMRTLNGLVFDLEKGSTLHIELAKANSRYKRLKADDDRQSLDKRMGGFVSYSEGTFEDGVSSIHFPGMSNSAYNTSGYPSNQSHSDDTSLNEKASSPILKPLEPHAPQNNPPCPTNFVANLGHTCTEQELMNVFSRWPGFIKLKTQSRFGAPVAFIDFQDAASSTAALNQLQGTLLYSSPPGIGMRLEYAKSRMGQRKRK